MFMEHNCTDFEMDKQKVGYFIVLFWYYFFILLIGL